MDSALVGPRDHASLGPLGWAILPAYLGREFPAVAALAGYFDESFEAGGGIYVIAGYGATVQMWDSVFAPMWSQVIKSAPHEIPEYKASDCKQGQGWFHKKHGWTVEERSRLTADLLSVMERPQLDGVLFGFGAALVYPGFAVKEHRRRTEQHGYSYCMTVIVQRMAEVLSLFKSDELQIVMDKKDKFYKLMVTWYQHVQDATDAQISSRLPTPLFVDSEKSPPVQAADLLAHEVLLETRNRMLGKETRPELARLANSQFHAVTAVRWNKLVEARRCAQEKRPPPPDLRESLLFQTDKPWRAADHWPYDGQ